MANSPESSPNILQRAGRAFRESPLTAMGVTVTLAAVMRMEGIAFAEAFANQNPNNGIVSQSNKELPIDTSLGFAGLSMIVLGGVAKEPGSLGGVRIPVAKEPQFSRFLHRSPL